MPVAAAGPGGEGCGTAVPLLASAPVSVLKPRERGAGRQPPALLDLLLQC